MAELKIYYTLAAVPSNPYTNHHNIARLNLRFEFFFPSTADGHLVPALRSCYKLPLTSKEWNNQCLVSIDGHPHLKVVVTQQITTSDTDWAEWAKTARAIVLQDVGNRIDVILSETSKRATALASDAECAVSLGIKVCGVEGIVYKTICDIPTCFTLCNMSDLPRESWLSESP
jgi:hypothetical protein